MDIHTTIADLSAILADPATVGKAFAATVVYFCVVVIAIVVFAGVEFSAYLQVRKILRSDATDTAKVVDLNDLLRAQLPGADAVSTDEAPSFWRRLWNSISAPHRTRLGRAIGALLRAFAANAEGTHQKAGILPAELFLEGADPGSRFRVARWFDTLIRISLIVTFAGIAAVLFNVGLAVDSFGGPGSAGGSDMISKISPVISASATKFFTTVFALVFGTTFLILSQVADFGVSLLFRATAAGLDDLLATPTVNKTFAQDPVSVLSGAKQEEKQVLRALRENAEYIAKFGKSFENDILGGQRTLLAEQGARFSDLIEQLRALLNGLYSQGIALPIQSSVSQDVRALIEELVHSQGTVLVTLADQQEANRIQTDVLVGILYRLAKAYMTPDNLDEIFGSEFGKQEASRTKERDARAARKASHTAPSEQKARPPADLDTIEPGDDPAVINLKKQLNKGGEQLK